MPQVSANGLTFEVLETGPQDGPAVLLIMGLGCQVLHWRPEFVDGLAGQGFRVVRFDNRDAGLSSKFDAAGVPNIMGILEDTLSGKPAQAPYSLDDMARDAVGVLDALAIDKAHIVGASMGGMIAQIIAGRHATRAKSLVSIMSSSGDPDLPQAEPEVMGALLSPAPDPADREACVANAMAFWTAIRSPAYPAGDAELRAQCEAAIDRCYCPQGTARQIAAILAHGSRAEVLKTIQVPSLVLHGNADRLVPVACGVRTASLIPGAALTRIDGLGHDFTHANAPVYLREVGTFLTKVENSQ